MKHLRLYILLPIIWLSGFALGSDQNYVPATTKVAIVPVLNISGEKWEELKQKQCERGDTFLHEEFDSRGFDVIPLKLVQSKIKELKIDFTDDEQQKRSTLYDLGRQLDADLIVMAIITDTSQRVVQQFLSSKREGKTKMKVWLLDVKQEHPIIRGDYYEGKSGGGFFAGLDKGSERQIIAVANGLRDALKDFFTPYPVTKEKAQ